MKTIRLGRTNLKINQNGFGAIPIQRVDFIQAKKLLCEAYQNGFNFFDTARAYTDSEEKIGYALSTVRGKIIIATKSAATNKQGLLEDLRVSLNHLKTNYVDIIQLHNPSALPDSDDPEGTYAGLREAQRLGMTKFIGITCHRLDLARQAIQSQLYDTVQYPLSPISNNDEMELVLLCRKYDIGFIAMKALAGGLINKASVSFAFINQYNNVLPIWGIEKKWQLDQFISMVNNPPEMNSKMIKLIKKYKDELAGSFCRGCGYCMPCPEGIPIHNAARIEHLLKRSPLKKFINQEWNEKMSLIDNCRKCNQCVEKCPYHLDIPALLQKMLIEYRNKYTKYN